MIITLHHTGACFDAQVTLVDIEVFLRAKSAGSLGHFYQAPDTVMYKGGQHGVDFIGKRLSQILARDGQSGAKTGNVVAEKVDVKMAGIGELTIAGSGGFAYNPVKRFLTH